MNSKRAKNIALSILIATGIAGFPVIMYYLADNYRLVAYFIMGLLFVGLIYFTFRLIDSGQDNPDTR